MVESFTGTCRLNVRESSCCSCCAHFSNLLNNDVGRVEFFPLKVSFKSCASLRILFAGITRALIKPRLSKPTFPTRDAIEVIVGLICSCKVVRPW